MNQNRKHTKNKIWSTILMIALVMLTVAWQPVTSWAAESQAGAGQDVAVEQAVTGAEQDTLAAEQNVTTEQAVDTASSADKKDIVIEVVEDIPADTIEDESVPLAATPATATHNGMRVGIPVALAVVIVLTWFYGRNRRARAEVSMYRE